MAESLDIVHRDDRLLAINKHSGALVHRGWANEADAVVVTELAAALVGHPVFPAHRIDRATSGLLLLALDEDAARALGAQFEAGTVGKRYLALTRGLAPEAIEIDYPLRPLDGKTGKRRKTEDARPAQPARTSLRRLAAVEFDERNFSLVEARPHSGRTHQIRRHLKHISHPIIGDVRYGKGALNRRFREAVGLQRLALHAAALTLVHPNGEALTLRAPLPADLAEPLLALGFAVDGI